MSQKSVRFPDELQARAEVWARENDRPFSYVVVKALEQFLARESDPEMVAAPHRPSAPDHAQKTREMDAAKEFVAKKKAAPVADEPSEPVGGCPECGGWWAYVSGTSQRACMDCGAREAS